MSSSGGGKETTTNSIPSWMRPYAESYMQNSQNVASRPYQAYGGQSVAQLNPYETAGMNAQAQRAMQGSSLNEAAGGEVQKTLQGGYLNNNPYMSGMVDQASQDVNRNYDGIAARSGSFGNVNVERERLGALSDASTRLRGQDYAAERGRMQNAVGMAPQIANQDYIDASALQNAGQGFRNAEQRNATDDQNRFNEARDYPERQLDIQGRGLGMNFGNQSSSRQSSNPWNTAIGTAAAAYGGYNAYNGGGK